MKSRARKLALLFTLATCSALAHGNKIHVLGTLEKISPDSVLVKTKEGKFGQHIKSQRRQARKNLRPCRWRRRRHSCHSQGQRAGSGRSAILRSDGCQTYGDYPCEAKVVRTL
jgi:hypothetical protein